MKIYLKKHREKIKDLELEYRPAQVKQVNKDTDNKDEKNTFDQNTTRQTTNPNTTNQRGNRG